MSGEEIVVLDFANGVTRKVTHAEWAKERYAGCRAAGHIFVSAWPDAPTDGETCICGDITWPRVAVEPAA